MNKQTLKKHSKFLSLILRHKPEVVGVQLDSQGWIEIKVLLEAMAKNGRHLTRPQLDEIVASNDKKRFTFNEDGSQIRANQGHSVSIDLALEPQVPPDTLFHGTAVRFLDAIREQGLIKRSRQHVHLSADEKTAHKVGSRHGKPVILRIDAKKMHANQHQFFISKNGVWLTDHVPTQYIEQFK